MGTTRIAIRPVRQLTIKSLLFLVVLWSLLSLPIAHLPRAWKGEHGIVLLGMAYAIYFGIWTVPIVASIFIRSLARVCWVSLTAYILVTGCFIGFKVPSATQPANLNPVNPIRSYRITVTFLAADPFVSKLDHSLRSSYGMAIELAVLVAHTAAFVSLGPIFAKTCRLREVLAKAEGQ